MAQKPVAGEKISKVPRGTEQSHKPATHIEEIARLASSDTKKDLDKVRKAKN